MNSSSAAPVVRVKEIAYTGYPVSDLPRARAFYEGLLGLKPANVWGDEAKAWIEYELGASTLAITNMFPEKWQPSMDGPCLALEVENFEEAIDAIKAAGVKFYLEPLKTEVCQMAVVADPDGNSLTIHHRDN